MGRYYLEVRSICIWSVQGATILRPFNDWITIGCELAGTNRKAQWEYSLQSIYSHGSTPRTNSSAAEHRPLGTSTKQYKLSRGSVRLNLRNRVPWILASGTKLTWVLDLQLRDIKSPAALSSSRLISLIFPVSLNGFSVTRWLWTPDTVVHPRTVFPVLAKLHCAHAKNIDRYVVEDPIIFQPVSIASETDDFATSVLLGN